MNNKIKLILSIALMISSILFIFQSLFGGICVFLAGLVLYPKFSNRLRNLFPFWKNKAIRVATPIFLFIIGSIVNSIQNKDAITLNKKEEIVINYIKQNTENDKSLLNLKVLIETGSLFNNGNYVLSTPSSYLQSKIDTITKMTTFILNPHYNFNTAINNKYLREDNQKGAIKDYQIFFILDDDNRITSKKTYIEYAKTGREEYDNESVPKIIRLINNDIVSSRKIIVKKQEDIDAVIGNDDFWKKFDPMVKTRIYTLIKNKDCEGLQKEFNTTADHADRFHKIKDTRATKHTELMYFIDDKMKELGCYK